LERVLEAIFRRTVRLLLLIFALPIVSIVIVYVLPRTYQVTSSLWALRRYEIVGSTGLETDLSSSPAQSQATTLTELLQTRDFALVVAKETNLASTFDPSIRSDPQKLDDALVTELSQHVQVQAQGYNLFVISYSNRDPHVAQQVVASIIQAFGLQSLEFSTFEGDTLLQSYQAQLDTARKDADAAAVAEAQYLAAHPNLANEILRLNPQYGELADPQYALLHARTQQAQAVVDNIETQIAAIRQDISSQKNGTDSLFKVIDAPIVPIHPVGRVKDYLIYGATGLVLGLAACALYIVMALRRDRAVYAVDDLQRVTAYPVVLQLPDLTSVSVPLLLKGATQNGRLPGGEAANRHS
jgi:hypothetical protein